MTAGLPKNEMIAMPFEQYDADRTAVRKGWLDLIDKSPAHLKASLDGLLERDSEALTLGSVIHTFVLEPDSIASRYYREPDGNRSTKGWKERAAELASLNPGKGAVRPNHWDTAMAIRESVYAHKAASKLLSADGVVEQSVFFDNDETGELCKARYDKLSITKAFIADVKSTRDASPAAFARSIVDYRYDVQASHYREAIDLRFVFIAVECLPPYAVAVYADNPEIVAYGQKRRLPNLRTYAECRASGRFPSYPQTIQHISLPQWVKRSI